MDQPVHGGVGGHPIDLDRCVDLADPSKGTDCANQMIQDDVAAVVIGSNAVLENVWTPLHNAGHPGVPLRREQRRRRRRRRLDVRRHQRPGELLALPAGAAKSGEHEEGDGRRDRRPGRHQLLQGPAPDGVQGQGLDFKLVPIAAGTADMTPQMQQVTSDNPNGVVYVIGNDAFCIAAFNGLRTAGFKGKVTVDPAVPHRRDPYRGARRTS